MAKVNLPPGMTIEDLERFNRETDRVWDAWCALPWTWEQRMLANSARIPVDEASLMDPNAPDVIADWTRHAEALREEARAHREAWAGSPLPF